MAITKFQARHATLAYIATAVTWDVATQANDEALTANVAEVKNITVVLPEMAVEQVPCMGYIAQTIGANARTAAAATGVIGATFQCAALIATSISNWQFTGTLVLTGDEQFIQILGLDAGTAIATAAAQRYAVGNLHASTFDWARSQIGTLRIFLNNASEEATVVMSNVAITKIGDLKPTGADGHFEVDFAAECLPKDGAIEYLA